MGASLDYLFNLGSPGKLKYPGNFCSVSCHLGRQYMKVCGLIAEVDDLVLFPSSQAWFVVCRHTDIIVSTVCVRFASTGLW
jgi:hypothetical protein